MKPVLIYAICAAFALAFFGCATEEKETPVSASSEFKTSDELILEAEAREKQQTVSREEERYGQIAGVYFFRSQEINEQFWPRLELSLDGKAVFYANLLTNMGSLEGQYTFSDGTVRFAVEKVSFTGFAGEKVTDMLFETADDGSLKLSYTTPETAVGITVSGDQFVKAQ